MYPKIGGLLSEIIFEVEKKWNPPLCPLVLAWRGVLTFPGYVLVPKDKGTFNSVGMHGWVKPELKVFGTVDLCGFPINLAAVQLWDTHPEGRVGPVLTLAPKNQHNFLMAYFSSVEPSQCMSAELKALAFNKVLLSPTRLERGVVLWARYVGKIYISLVDIPPHVRFLELCLSALYKALLKWEKSPEEHVTWCEASIHMVKNTPTLLMKGVKWQPLSHAFPLVGDFQLWDKWVGASSSNAQLAQQFLVPTLSECLFFFGYVNN